ncbi:MAG: hypothetical protein AB7N54_00695 [Alphaproteobacteria bacterium]
MKPIVINGLASALLAMATAGAAAAASPAAVVEEVADKSADVEEMEFVAAGQVIRLAAGGRLVLGYLASCVREEITGGTVTIGENESTVAGGKVERGKTPCAGTQLALSDRQTRSSGVVVFRAPPTAAKPAATPEPAYTLYGTAPLVELGTAGTLVLERLDTPGERQEIAIPEAGLRRGAFYDFAATDTALAAGGLYRARFGTREVVFKVDPLAKAGKSPLVGRLLRFPAS